MQRRQLLTGIAAGLPLLAGCSSLLGGGSVIDSSNLSKYTSDKYGYSVKYPSKWSKKKMMGPSVQFTYKNDDGEPVGAMVAQAIPPIFTLDEYIDKIKQVLKKDSEKFSTSETKKIGLPNDHTGKALTMTIDTSSGGSGGLLSIGGSSTIKGRAVFASGDTHLYTVIVYVHEDDYDATESAIKEILKSLTIK